MNSPLDQIRTERDWTQGEVEMDHLDYLRDNNVMPVYKCFTCGFRAVGAAVTLHPFSHGPMILEGIRNESQEEG